MDFLRNNIIEDALDFKEPLNKLTDYFIEENHITSDTDFYVERINAKRLICSARFDLMAKMMYIEAKDKGCDTSFALDVYRNNINAFSCGNFSEPGNDHKNSFEKYVSAFDSMIEDIKINGFDGDKSIIPVDSNDVFFDGAHRVSIAAYYELCVATIKFPDRRLHNLYDYKFFEKFLMFPRYMGYMAIQYAKQIKNCYMVCIWPIANRAGIEKAESILEEIGTIVYSQDVYLTYEGMRNFMIQVYGKDNWIGSVDDKFLGVNAKVDLCYNKKNPVKTYLVESRVELEEIVEIKAKIRRLFNIENHSVHISDTYSETVEMTELLYNPNSVNFLNFAHPYKWVNVYNSLSRLDTIIRRNKLDKNRILIDSSSVLEICGLREAKDVDYLTDYSDDEVERIISSDCADNHKLQLKYYNLSVKDLLYIPENYFYYKGFKFVSIDRLIDMKKNRGEQKDLRDCKLLNTFRRQFRKIPLEYQSEIIERIAEYQMNKGDYGKGILPYAEYRKHIFVDTLFPVKRMKKFCYEFRDYMYSRKV